MNRRNALITGVGREKGIGAAIVRALAEEYDIFFTYWAAYDESMPWGRNIAEAERVRRDALDKGARCETLEIDLSRPEAPGELMDAVRAAYGRMDVLVNNAAYSTNFSYEDITPEEIDRHYFVNLRATLMLSALFGRYYTYDGGARGKIISLTSGQFKGPMLNEIAYVATKGAIDAMTISLAQEMAPKGICVNAVNPGPCDSGWIDEELAEILLPKFPFGRIGQPEDPARLIRFLASPEADWITGQTMHTEGGFHRG